VPTLEFRTPNAENQYHVSRVVDRDVATFVSDLNIKMIVANSFEDGDEEEGLGP
jgi:hypothetical protein